MTTRSANLELERLRAGIKALCVDARDKGQGWVSIYALTHLLIEPAPAADRSTTPDEKDAPPMSTTTTTADHPQIDTLTVATDGACSGNPGPAGWAWVDEHGAWRNGGLLRATNQVGELLGLLHAVRDHHHVRHLTIEIDSIYAMNTYSAWMDAHAARGWTTQAKKPTSNREIIEQLIAARDARRAAGQPPVKLVKVKGHSRGKHPLNDAADDRATAASAQARAKQVGPWSGDGMVIGGVKS